MAEQTKHRPVGVTFRSPEKAEPYLVALRRLGVEYRELTPEEPWTLEGLAGLLVTGGGADINPSLYGQETHPATDGPPDAERDRMEMQLIKSALETDLPLLCICRGMQMMNVVHGGDLDQHISERDLHWIKPPPGKRHESIHMVNVEAGSRLAEILGDPEHPVNSRHHQAVSHVGRYLRVSARAPDGVIEAIERTEKRFAIGCQWHPEESILTNPGDRRIMEAFAAAL